MSFLNPTQKQTLALICDTLVPALTPEKGDDVRLFGLNAAQLHLADALEAGIEQITEASDRIQLQLILNLFESPLLNRVAVGKRQAFSDMSLSDRTETLRSWGNSDIAPARQFFQSIKRLALFLFYASTPDNEPNPSWPSLHYPEQPPSAGR